MCLFLYYKWGDKLSTNVASKQTSKTIIDTASAGKAEVQTSNTRIVGGLVEVANNSTVSAGNERTFTYDFKDFKYPPIVSATPVNTGQTPAGQNVNIVLKSVTETRVEGVVRFGASGDLSLSVHLVIVGIPN